MRTIEMYTALDTDHIRSEVKHFSGRDKSLEELTLLSMPQIFLN